MIMSNFIDESERHAELFQSFTERQYFVIRLLKVFKNQAMNEYLIQYYLKKFITDAELRWLERTGRIRRGFN